MQLDANLTLLKSMRSGFFFRAGLFLCPIKVQDFTLEADEEAEAVEGESVADSIIVNKEIIKYRNEEVTPAFKNVISAAMKVGIVQAENEISKIKPKLIDSYNGLRDLVKGGLRREAEAEFSKLLSPVIASAAGFSKGAIGDIIEKATKLYSQLSDKKYAAAVKGMGKEFVTLLTTMGKEITNYSKYTKAKEVGEKSSTYRQAKDECSEVFMLYLSLIEAFGLKKKNPDKKFYNSVSDYFKKLKTAVNTASRANAKKLAAAKEAKNNS